MLRVCVLLAVFPLVCGCDDPIAPPAKIAVRTDLKTGSEGNCGSAGQASIPGDRLVTSYLNSNGGTNATPVDTTKFPYAVDGEGGATVSCVVHETAPGAFTISGDVYSSSGLEVFSVRGNVAANAGSGATIDWRHPPMQAAVSSTQCSLVVSQAQAGGGAIVASFSCPNMGNGSQTELACDGNGDFVLDRCDK